MDSENYNFGANQRNSLLLSQLSCLLSTHVYLLRFFYTGPWSMETIFSLSGSMFKPSQKHLQKTITTPHPPTYHFSLNQHKTYHHGGSTPSCQALHPEQDVPACWEYAAHQDKESTPINSDHATSPMQPRHTPIPN